MPEHPATQDFLFWHRARHSMRRVLWKLVLLVMFLVFLFILINMIRGASNTRSWAADHAVAPTVEIASVGTTTLYIIDGVRITDYTKKEPVVSRYQDRIMRTDITNMWYVVVPFAGFGAAHTFLSFEMDDGTFLSVSVEARREKDETYSPWLGLIDQYELIYVVADERDIIGRRVLVDNDPVYVYPTIANAQQSQQIFDSIMRRIARLEETPESYDTIFNNCTTNLADHVNATIGDGTVPWSSTLVMPKESDRYALSLGLLAIGPGADIEQERKRHLVNEVASSSISKINFSKIIRESLSLYD
jgi:hypothetical protein